jgi:nucleoside-diphosphate-sugar epimerase
MTNLLVTGSNGFIGKSLVSSLRNNPEYNIFLYDLEQGDISKDIIPYENIDHVFHLAGKSFVPDSWENPLDFYRVNVLGAVNVLEFCRKNDCTATVISSYVYGDPEYLPIPETAPLKSYNPYSHTKTIIEDVCKFFCENYHLNVTVIRPFNVYGPGQNDQFLIPYLIKMFISSTSASIEVKDLRPKRDYIYIHDLVRVLVMTISRKGYAVYNAGTGISYSVREIIELIAGITKIDKPVKSLGVERQNEILDVRADIAKIEKELGWNPLIPLEEGIRRCILDISPGSF